MHGYTHGHNQNWHGNNYFWQDHFGQHLDRNMARLSNGHIPSEFVLSNSESWSRPTGRFPHQFVQVVVPVDQRCDSDIKDCFVHYVGRDAFFFKSFAARVCAVCIYFSLELFLLDLELTFCLPHWFRKKDDVKEMDGS